MSRSPSYSHQNKGALDTQFPALNVDVCLMFSDQAEWQTPLMTRRDRIDSEEIITANQLVFPRKNSDNMIFEGTKTSSARILEYTPASVKNEDFSHNLGDFIVNLKELCCESRWL